MRVAGEQCWRLLWPQRLSCDYSYDQIPLFRCDLANTEDMKSILVLLLLVLVGLGTLACFRRNRAVMFCLALCVLSYLPTSNLLIHIGSIMAERFMYLPLAGFAMLLTMAVSAVAGRLGAPLEINHHPSDWRRFAPHAVLSALIVAYGIRTFQRNFDWKSETTIFAAAIETTPASFKSYPALAEELYRANPQANVDDAIKLCARSVEILDDLPDDVNVVFPYVRLGGYFLTKAIFLSQVDADGSRTMTDRARPYFRAAATTFERAVPIDRTFNEINRRRQFERGQTAHQTPDTGNAGLYANLSEACHQLGLNDQAVQALRYAQHLTPTESVVWQKLAGLHLRTGQLEEACIALIQCLLIDPGQEQIWPLLESTYHRIDAKSPRDYRPAGSEEPQFGEPAGERASSPGMSGFVQNLYSGASAAIGRGSQGCGRTTARPAGELV